MNFPASALNHVPADYDRQLFVLRFWALLRNPAKAVLTLEVR